MGFSFRRVWRRYLFSLRHIQKEEYRKEEFSFALLGSQRKIMREHREQISSIELMSHSRIYGKNRNTFHGRHPHWEFG